MNLKANTTLKRKAFILLALTALAVFTNFYNLEKRHGFSWDQERDARIVWEIITEKNITLLGPQVVSATGFFLAPLHYYLLVPFYLSTQGDPIAGPILAGLVGVATTLFGTLILMRTIGLPGGIAGGLILATNPVDTSWNVMYLPLLTLATLYYALELMRGNKKALIAAGIITGLTAHVHFSAVFLVVFLLLAFFIGLKTRVLSVHRSLREMGIAAALVLLLISPLIVFDLTHNFQNAKTFMQFFESKDTGVVFNPNNEQVYLRSMRAITPYLRGDGTAIVTVLTMILAMAGVFLKYKKPLERFFWLFTLVFPFAALMFYSGQASEYYFMPQTYVLFFLTCVTLHALLTKTAVFYIPLAALAVVNTYFAATYTDGLSLYYKKQATQYVAALGELNLTYNMPRGLEVGFGYLLNHYNARITPNAQKTYTLAIPPDAEKEGKVVATFGAIGAVER